VQLIDEGKRSVLGVQVSVVDYESAVATIAAAARARVAFSVTSLPVHGIMTGAQDPRHRFRLNSFDVLTPDGQPVRWALNLIHGVGLKERVYGPTLMLALVEHFATEGLPIYLYGSRAETIALLSRNLQRRFPTLRIAGSQPGRFKVLSLDERAQIVRDIKESGAAAVFVGLGCPRQEIWAYENREELSMPAICVGAAFDFHAGTVLQAPPSLQRIGLEWAYRLTREPRRLWRRYVFLNPQYIAMVSAQLVRLVDFDAKAEVRPERDLNLG
jgi:N-acetylglucosaminyldiphosphoundecaprenol N-acetyl-beta-D-mannosaminyltransferase